MPILLLMLFSMISLASPTDSVVDYLRSTPALVTGSIRFDTEFVPYQGKLSIFNVGVVLDAKKDINFHFNENFLSIYSDEGITLTLAGLPVTIRHIEFNPKTKKFTVKSDTLTGIMENTYNSLIEEQLSKLFLVKMEKAFEQLTSLRGKQELGDVRQVMQIISGIFSNPGKPTPLPDLEGDVELVFFPKADKNLKMDELSIDIKAQDKFGVKLGFSRKNKKIQVSNVRINSDKGITLSGDTEVKSLASLVFKRVDLSKHGIVTYYALGVEDVLGSLIMTLRVFEAQYTGLPPDCDVSKLPKFATFRDELDAKFKMGISKLILEYTQELLDAGISMELLKALV